MGFMVLATRMDGFMVVLASSQGKRLSSFCQNHVFATKPTQLDPKWISSKSSWVFFSQLGPICCSLIAEDIVFVIQRATKRKLMTNHGLFDISKTIPREYGPSWGRSRVVLRSS